MSFSFFDKFKFVFIFLALICGVFVGARYLPDRLESNYREEILEESKAVFK